MNNTERRRSTFDEMWAYGIDPTSHHPTPTMVANHWATQPAPRIGHTTNFPDGHPELTIWHNMLDDLGYKVTPSRRSNRPGVIDTDRAARDYAKLTSPRRPYLPGDPRMMQPNEAIIWATDFRWQRMWSTPDCPPRPFPKELSDRINTGMRRFFDRTAG